MNRRTLARLLTACGVLALAAFVIVLYQQPHRVDKHIRLLQHSDWNVREGAAKALGTLGDPRAIEPLIRCMQDGDAGMRPVALDAVVRFGSAAVEPLAGCLNDGDPLLREKVIRALAALNDPRAVAHLIRYLETKPTPVDYMTDPGDGVRRAAVEALGKLGDPRAIEPLMACFRERTHWRI